MCHFHWDKISIESLLVLTFLTDVLFKLTTKLYEKFIAHLLHMEHLLVGLVLHQQLEIIEIVSEVVFAVLFNVIFWSFVFPIISDCFSSLIELYKLLELEVCASKSVLKPVNGNPFNSKS